MILFENARLFDGTRPETREGHWVLVEGTRIREVRDGPIVVRGETRRYDLAGRTLMPGLIDAHFHAVAAHPDLSRIEAMPASLLAQYSRGFLEAALQRGFTSVRDAGGADHGLARACDSGLVRGPRLFFSGKALTQTGGHGDFSPHETGGGGFMPCHCCRGGATLASIADGVDAVRRAARDELRKGATQIKIMASGGVASPSDPIWNLQYSDDEIAAAVWEATSWKRYVMAHAYTAEAITRCLELGVRTIEHANLIDAPTAALAARRGAYVVPTLVTYEAMGRYGEGAGLPRHAIDKLHEVAEAGLSSLEILKAAGVRVGLGTDLLGELHRYQSRELSLRAEVLGAAEVLISATSLNAAILQMDGHLGVVAEGALADLLVVDGDPLADISLLERQGDTLAAVLKDGAFVKNRLDA